MKKYQEEGEKRGEEAIKNCGDCGRWVKGGTDIVGDCMVEMEGTTYDHLCGINLWIPKEGGPSYR